MKKVIRLFSYNIRTVGQNPSFSAHLDYMRQISVSRY